MISIEPSSIVSVISWRIRNERDCVGCCGVRLAATEGSLVAMFNLVSICFNRKKDILRLQQHFAGARRHTLPSKKPSDSKWDCWTTEFSKEPAAAAAAAAADMSAAVACTAACYFSTRTAPESTFPGG